MHRIWTYGAYPMAPSLGKGSLLHMLGYSNPNVWHKLGFPTLASFIRHLGSLHCKLGFLTLASCILYLSLWEKLLAFSSSINKRFSNLQILAHCPKFHIEFLLLEARNSLSWRLAQPPSRFSPSTSPSTFLHAFFIAFSWLLQHEEFIYCFHSVLQGFTKLNLHWSLHKKLKHLGAPPSFGIMSFGLQELSSWSFSLCFGFSMLYTTIFTCLDCFVPINCCVLEFKRFK